MYLNGSVRETGEGKEREWEREEYNIKVYKVDSIAGVSDRRDFVCLKWQSKGNREG